MTIDEEFYDLIRSDLFTEAHSHLDRMLTTASTPEDFSAIAMSRTYALVREKRYKDALKHLVNCKSVYTCRTLVHHNASEMLDRLGRGQDAINELNDAPFEQEVGRFPTLVKDAQFYLLFLRAKHGPAPDLTELDQIPDDFGSVIMPFGPFSKERLRLLIERRSGRDRQKTYRFE